MLDTAVVLRSLMKTCLELIRARQREIEASLTAPCTGRISASTDFVRQLIEEFREHGEEVCCDLATNTYFFDGIAIGPSGHLPKGTFVIDLT